MQQWSPRTAKNRQINKIIFKNGVCYNFLNGYWKKKMVCITVLSFLQRTPSILPSILTLSILPTLGYSVLPSKIPMLLTQAQGLTQMRFVKWAGWAGDGCGCPQRQWWGHVAIFGISEVPAETRHYPHHGGTGQAYLLWTKTTSTQVQWAWRHRRGVGS